jgi:two-component system OmpR family response regulator
MAAASPTKHRIFVAEDDKLVLELIRTRLLLADYDVSFGRDGWEAVRGIRENPPTAILLDINMPKLDGFGVLEELRRHDNTASIPVMALTARNSPDDIQRAIKLGARDYLAKPFKDAQLLARVSRLVRTTSQHKPRANRSLDSFEI